MKLFSPLAFGVFSPNRHIVHTVYTDSLRLSIPGTRWPACYDPLGGSVILRLRAERVLERYTQIWHHYATGRGYLTSFGETISLQSWLLQNSVEVRACQDIFVEDWWFARQSPTSGYRIRLALANAGDMGVVLSDALPTSQPADQSRAGSHHLSVETLQIPCDLQPGSYALALGVVDMASGDLLPVTYPDGTPNNSSLIYLTTLTVQP
jgi:hypothetical protein